MFEIFLSVKMPFRLVGASRMPRRYTATLAIFRKKHLHAQLFLLSLRRRRCGGRARSDRYTSWLIGVKVVARRNIPIDASGLIVSIKCFVIRGRVRYLPALNGTHIHWGRQIGDGIEGSCD